MFTPNITRKPLLFLGATRDFAQNHPEPYVIKCDEKQHFPTVTHPTQ